MTITAEQVYEVMLSTEPANKEEAERLAQIVRPGIKAIWLDNHVADIIKYYRKYRKYSAELNRPMYLARIYKNRIHRAMNAMIENELNDWDSIKNVLKECEVEVNRAIENKNKLVKPTEPIIMALIEDRYFRFNTMVDGNQELFDIVRGSDRFNPITDLIRIDAPLDFNISRDYRYNLIELYLMSKRDLSERSTALIKLHSVCGGYYFINDCVYLLERPEIIKYRINNDRNNRVEFHSTDGPAVKFRGGKEFYILNNRRMPKRIFDKGLDKMSAQDIITLRNVEQRAQMMLYRGVDKIIEDLGYEVIDKEGDYELIGVKLALSDRNKDQIYTYLRMVCPSTGNIHVEDVGQTFMPAIKTVDEAIKWRNNGRTSRPVVLT